MAKKLLIVVDMQNDFISGALGSKAAQAIVPAVAEKIKRYKQNGDSVIFTRDTHQKEYLSTQEGKYLPVLHCVAGTEGHKIASGLDTAGAEIIDKPSFGSMELSKHVAAMNPSEIELCGLCTDICVVSNALILKAALPETKITVDSRACAGVSEESHNAALTTMKMCQINVN